MGLEGQWECPQCEIFNYQTKTCRKCGYVISPDSCLIKGNPLPFVGRHSDPTLIKCKCGWIGKVMDSNHTYRAVYPDDVEPVDLCPKCGREV